MNYGYSRIQPMNTKTSYEEFDVVDFSIQIPEGRSLLLGSVRLEGEVEVSATGGITLNQTTNVNTIPANTLDIKIDSDAGAHGFIEQVSTSFSGPSFSGLGESLGDYGRYVKMSSVAMTRSNGDNNNSSNVCELKAVNDEATNNILKGELVAADNNNSMVQCTHQGQMAVSNRAQFFLIHPVYMASQRSYDANAPELQMPFIVRNALANEIG